MVVKTEFFKLMLVYICYQLNKFFNSEFAEQQTYEVGRDSSVSIVFLCELNDRGIESEEVCEIYRTLPDRSLDPTSLLYSGNGSIFQR
jgi:hypothetical protein